MALQLYRDKRNFQRTPEPRGKTAKSRGMSFVIHKHAARRIQSEKYMPIRQALHIVAAIVWHAPQNSTRGPRQGQHFGGRAEIRDQNATLFLFG